jgi:Bax protein
MSDNSPGRSRLCIPHVLRRSSTGLAEDQGERQRGEPSPTASPADSAGLGPRRSRALSFTVLYLAVVAAAIVPPRAAIRWADDLIGHAAQRLGDATESSGPRWQNKFPLDLADVVSVAERKQRFVAALLPVVKAESLRIAEQRAWLVKNQRRLIRGTATATLRHGLTKLVREYRLARRFTVPATGPVPPRLVEELLPRIDSLPPSLVLAQAAIESGWGTSRFLREGNNLFGQWVTGETPGLAPAEAKLADYRVATYDSVAYSVRSYLRNINTHRAYRQLRRWRADLRAVDAPLDSTILSAGLVRYSQRGEAYVEELLDIIRGNRLDRFDATSVQLASNRSGWGLSTER